MEYTICMQNVTHTTTVFEKNVFGTFCRTHEDHDKKHFDECCPQKLNEIQIA